jgi:hypothetical protein
MTAGFLPALAHEFLTANDALAFLFTDTVHNDFHVGVTAVRIVSPEPAEFMRWSDASAQRRKSFLEVVTRAPVEIAGQPDAVLEKTVARGDARKGANVRGEAKREAPGQ